VERRRGRSSLAGGRKACRQRVQTLTGSRQHAVPPPGPSPPRPGQAVCSCLPKSLCALPIVASCALLSKIPIQARSMRLLVRRAVPALSGWIQGFPWLHPSGNVFDKMPMPKTMRAVVMRRRGPASEVLEFHSDWPVPVRKPNQVHVVGCSNRRWEGGPQPAGLQLCKAIAAASSHLHRCWLRRQPPQSTQESGEWKGSHQASTFAWFGLGLCVCVGGGGGGRRAQGARRLPDLLRCGPLTLHAFAPPHASLVPGQEDSISKSPCCPCSRNGDGAPMLQPRSRPCGLCTPRPPSCAPLAAAGLCSHPRQAAQDSGGGPGGRGGGGSRGQQGGWVCCSAPCCCWTRCTCCRSRSGQLDTWREAQRPNCQLLPVPPRWRSSRRATACLLRRTRASRPGSMEVGGSWLQLATGR
jgi:hypothetical protein